MKKEEAIVVGDSNLGARDADVDGGGGAFADENAEGDHEDAGVAPSVGGLIDGEDCLSKSHLVPAGSTSEQELRHYMVSHLSFRSRCTYDASSLDISKPHVQHIDEGVTRVVNIDFGYLGEERLLPILVGRDSVTMSTVTLPSPSKHSSGQSI